MKIAFPTNDRKTLAQRTGRCKEFVIYTLENKQVVDTKYFENTHTHHDHKHGEEEHSHSHNEIVQILEGIDVLYVLKIGKHMKRDLENGKINYKITQNENIEEILKQL